MGQLGDHFCSWVRQNGEVSREDEELELFVVFEFFNRRFMPRSKIGTSENISISVRHAIDV